MSTTHEAAWPQPYEGYALTPELREEARTDGDALYVCVLTATEQAERPVPVVFARTIAVSQAQAAVTNQRQPGVAPQRGEMEASLLGIGVTYMQALIDLVNRGFRTIAPANTLAVNEVRSRLGMSDAALRLREGDPRAGN